MIESEISYLQDKEVSVGKATALWRRETNYSA